jgi:hypothetical protein
LKKPDRKWVAILVLLAGMAWGAAPGANPAPQHPPAALEKNLISGG